MRFVPRAFSCANLPDDGSLAMGARFINGQILDTAFRLRDAERVECEEGASFGVAQRAFSLQDRLPT
jgi:hypothetical protein